MNPPEREPAWRSPVRILAAAVVSIGGVVVLGGSAQCWASSWRC